MSAPDPAAQEGKDASLHLTDSEANADCDTEAVALDIETSGLGNADVVTCVCICAAEWERVWVKEMDVHAICSALNKASVIYGYNAGGFDIPFMQRAWKLSDTQVGVWMSKLVDPLYCVRGLFGTGMCVKLQDVLTRNGMQGKSGSGADAVQLAKDGKWKELSDYCLRDTRQTLELLQQCQKSKIYWNETLEFVKTQQWSLEHCGLAGRE